MYSRHASETWASMSSLVEKAVARYGMLARPSPSRTYSTKSVELASRVSPVRWSRTFRPDEPGTKWTRSPPRSACGSPARSYRTNELGSVGDRPLDDVAREQDALAGVVERQAVLEEAPAHLRPADLHADLGQDALGLVDDPGGELLAQDLQAGTHPLSSGPTVGRWSGMGFPMPSAFRLMRPGVASAGMRPSPVHEPRKRVTPDGGCLRHRASGRIPRNEATSNRTKVPGPAQDVRRGQVVPPGTDRVSPGSPVRASAGHGWPGPGRAPSAPSRSGPQGRRGPGRPGADSPDRPAACRR